MAPVGMNVNGEEKMVPVITGVSGRFPNCENLGEFRQKLYDGTDMVTEDSRRWTPGIHGTPRRSGKINSLDKFDARFFNISPKQAHVMDPMVRMLMEATYEAIFDAGINPATLRGSRTGVYIATSTSASESCGFYLRDPANINGLCGPGCCRSVFANRISLFFDFKGPSFPVDATCASSLVCMDLAAQALITGRIDYAIVAGCNVCLTPSDSVMLQNLGVLSIDGKCKAFDESASGYVRSEAVVAIVMQKSTDRIYRNYCSVLGTLALNDGYRELGLLAPSDTDQADLLREVYKQANVNPKEVSYVESHGSGTQIGDKFEIYSMQKVMCDGRTKPLLVGSVKSNCGHSEPTAGLLSLVKILLSAQERLIPANLHFKTPNPAIPGLFEGKIKIITENTPWEGGFAGLSALGIGGNSAHVVLHFNSSRLGEKTDTLGTSALHPLVVFSGRTEEGLKAALNSLEHDGDVVALLHQFFKYNVPNHQFRGYKIFKRSGHETEVIRYTHKKPGPVWFVFPGVGSQWPGMGKELLALPQFKKTVTELSKVLKPHGIDLLDLLTSTREDAVKSPINTFVGITAVQIGLVDLLADLGIKPEGIIGHSVGELACGYADGCFTAEQTILSSLARGKAVVEARCIEGAMAAVGLPWKEAEALCPNDISVACHNSSNNSTVSGPMASVETFVADLTKRGVFAKILDSAGSAFHSKHIAPAMAKYKESLERIITSPKARSSKWISTSVPDERRETELGRYSSAAYHANNFVSPVLFEEAVKAVPASAVVIELTSHTISQTVLRSALPKTATIVPLGNKNAQDQLTFFLRAIGKIYAAGHNPDVSKLYPPASFPVRISAPIISPLMSWEHSDTWEVVDFEANPHVGPEQIKAVAPVAADPNEALQKLLVETLLKSIGGFGLGNGAAVPQAKPAVQQQNGSGAPLSLIGIVSRSLGISNIERLTDSFTMYDIGMDSILASELKAALSERLGLDYPMSRIRYMTIAELTRLDGGAGAANGKGGSQIQGTSAEGLLRGVLGIPEFENIEPDTNFLELGLDSMLAIQLKKSLLKEHNVDLSVEELFRQTLTEFRRIGTLA